ncbi:hypothetical protein [Acinetobacter sp. AND/436]|uniref:hypothetical protein n=1 Tax=Acinetobacter sp. AND/436 TaxID=3414736 RepID=UPI003C2BDA38
MDIQELNQFESVYQPSKEITFCWGVKKYVQLSVEENHTEIVDHANDSLRIWQAAKAQAVPEGFVVVDSEPNRKVLEKLSYIFPDICDSRIFVAAYKAMIEAQEPADD